MKLNVIEFPVSLFSMVDGYVLTCEASDMGNRHLQPIGNGKVGFAVNMNGKVLHYYLTRTVKDDDMEIKFWEYRLTPESVSFVPECEYTYATIFND